jgi:hypothetical protein
MVAERSVVTIDQLPQTAEAFALLQERVARTPEGGAAVMVVALLLYAEDRVLGERCLDQAVDGGRLHTVAGGQRLGRRDLQLMASQVGGRPHVLRSYLAGTCPEGGYQMPEPPLGIEWSANPYSGDVDSGQYKVFVTSSGADSPRPVTVRRDAEGLWKAYEWSSLLLGVRDPVQ